MKSKTPRVVLCRMEATDVCFRNKLANDPNVNRFVGFKLPVTMESTLEWFRERSKDDNTHLFVVEDSKTEEPVGYIRVAVNFDEAEIHVIIDPMFQRRGYGYASVNEVAKWLFSMPTIRKIFVRVNRNNYAALKMFKKCGFLETGEIVLSRVKG